MPPWVPPMNRPLIRLPFFNSKVSARAATTATKRATIVPHICFAFITSSPVHLLAGRLRPDSCQFLFLHSSQGLLAASRRKVLQQFLRSFIEPFLIFLRFLAGFNRMLGSTYPNQLSGSRVIHTNDK